MKCGKTSFASICGLGRVPALVALVLLGHAVSVLADTTSRILLVPFQVTSEAQEKELHTFADHALKRVRSAVTALGDGYAVESEQATEELLKGRASPATDEQAQALGLEAGSHFVIYGFLSYEDQRFKMKSVMWDLRNGRAVVSTDLKVDNIHGLPGVLQLFINSVTRRLHGSPSLPLYKVDPAVPGSGGKTAQLAATVSLPRSGGAGPWRSPEIEGTLCGLDIGDMDGDKRNETVFVERGGITISRFDGGSLSPLSQFSEAPAVYISAEAEDLDGDGVSELVVCYQTPSGIESALISYAKRNLEVTAKFPKVILRTVTEPSDEGTRILVGQETDVEDIFSGKMIRYQVKGGKATPSGELQLPPGTLLLSYDSGFMGKAKDFLRVILNQDQRLMVFDRENRLLENITDRIYGLNNRMRVPSKKVSKSIVFPGRLLISDTNGDGEHELLVIKQVEGMSEIQALAWDGARLLEKWKTIRSPGIISDFRIRDFKNGGIRSLVLILVKPNPFLALTGPRSVIYSYDLIP